MMYWWLVVGICFCSATIPIPEKVILGYANWAQCDQKLIEAVENGVNVLLWFSIDLAETNDHTPFIKSRVDPVCMVNIIQQIKAMGYTNVIHLMSIGGWNSPHPATNIPVEDMYQAFQIWNQEQAHGLLDGIDWDIEGHDDKDHIQNHVTTETIHYMGQFSQLAKADDCIVSMAPAESYLDPTTTKFDRSLRHSYKEWDQWFPDFTYHGRNTYAPLLTSTYRTTNVNGEIVDTFDLITIQWYEGYSHANYNLTKLNQPLMDYFQNFITEITTPWPIDFGADEPLQLPSESIHVPLEKLVIGLGNGWTVEEEKFLYISPEAIQTAYPKLSHQPRGFAFWNINDEGVHGVELTKGLNEILNIRD